MLTPRQALWRRWQAVLAVAAVGVLGCLTTAPRAWGAEAGVRQEPTCIETTETRDIFGKLVIECSRYVDSGDQGGTLGEGDSSAPERVCTYRGEEISCTLSDGAVWSGGRQCYIRTLDPQPPADDDRWEGHTDGVIIGCWNVDRCLVGDDALLIGCPIVSFFWAARGPQGVPPSPAQVAQDLVARLQVRAGEIGLAPPSYTERAGSQFVVGIPAWLWVDNPGPSTTEGVTVSDSQDGVAVTVTARLDRIVYSMGDGGSVTCGPGTRWTPAWGEADSPDCGYTYTRPGDYTITATSYWVAQWSGMGQSGSIPLDVSNSVPVRVGEIQVLLSR